MTTTAKFGLYLTPLSRYQSHCLLTLLLSFQLQLTMDLAVLPVSMPHYPKQRKFKASSTYLLSPKPLPNPVKQVVTLRNNMHRLSLNINNKFWTHEPHSPMSLPQPPLLPPFLLMLCLMTHYLMIPCITHPPSIRMLTLLLFVKRMPPNGLPP